MARYVLSHRQAGLRTRIGRVRSRDAALSDFDRLLANRSDVLNRVTPADDAGREIILFDADPAEIALTAALTSPDVLIEPELVRRPAPLRRIEVDSVPAQPAGTGQTLTVTVTGAGTPVAGAHVTLYLRAPGLGKPVAAICDAAGVAVVEFGPEWTVAAVEVSAAGFWSGTASVAGSSLPVALTPLPVTGPRAWWHLLGGADSAGPVGEGVVVGIVDSGVGPHPDLDHVEIAGSVVDTVRLSDVDSGRDVGWHGTHVAGIVAGRPAAASGRPGGVAPGARVVALRVIGPTGGTNQFDITAAIDALSIRRGADLINLSLESPIASDLERDAIMDALDLGTLCVASAGNTGAEVQFPAAYPEVVAVSAVGLTGWAPAGSVSAGCEPAEPARHGSAGLFLADFSSVGQRVEAAGPGVGIISTMPGPSYAAQDGTSMASPFACGILAVVLSRSAEWAALPRGRARTVLARELLRSACRDIGLAAPFAGRGVPVAAASVPVPSPGPVPPAPTPPAPTPPAPTPLPPEPEPVPAPEAVPAPEPATEPAPEPEPLPETAGPGEEPQPRDWVVAVRRDSRAGCADWLDRVRAVDGVTVVGADTYRARVETDPDGARRLAAAVGDCCVVEPLIEHRLS